MTVQLQLDLIGQGFGAEALLLLLALLPLFSDSLPLALELLVGKRVVALQPS